MPIAISPEQRALQASIRDWAQRAGTLALVRRLEPGAPGTAAGAPATAAAAAHWDALAGLGISSIALPEASGGAGGTVADQILLSMVAERALGLPREEAR